MADIVASSEVSGTEQLIHSIVNRSAQFDSVACSSQKSFMNHLGCTSTWKKQVLGFTAEKDFRTRQWEAELDSTKSQQELLRERIGNRGPVGLAFQEKSQMI